MPLQRLNCLRSCLPNVVGISRKEKKTTSTSPLVADISAHIGDDNNALPHRSSDCLLESQFSVLADVSQRSTPHPLPVTRPGAADNGYTNFVSVSLPSTPNASDSDKCFSAGVSGTKSRPQAPPVPLHRYDHGVDGGRVDVGDSLLDESQEDYIALDQCHSGLTQHQRQSTSSSTTSSRSPQTPSGSCLSQLTTGRFESLHSECSSQGAATSAAVVTSIYSNDSFLLDVVPPSPCRGGQVQLKPVPADYDSRHKYYGAPRQTYDHDSAAVPTYTEASRSPPLRPPPNCNRPIPDYSRIIVADIYSPPVTSSVGSLFQSPPPVQRRTIDSLSLSTVGCFSDVAASSATSTSLRNGRDQRDQRQRGRMLRSANVQSDRSRSSSDEDLDDSFDDDPSITLPRFPAPAVPDRRCVTPSLTPASRAANYHAHQLSYPSSDRDPFPLPRLSDRRLSPIGVDGSSVEDSPQYVERDRGVSMSPGRSATVVPPGDNYQNSSSSSLSSSSYKAIGVSTADSVPSATEQLFLSTTSLHGLHASLPAPHVSSAKQVRQHRYINAGAVTFDPNKKGDSRIIVPPMPSSSKMADYLTHATRTLPDQTKSPGGQGRYYNTDVPPRTEQSSLDRNHYRTSAAVSHHNSSFDSSHRGKLVRCAYSVEVPLPTKRRLVHDECVSSDDDAIHSSGQSGYSSASSLDRPVAPAPSCFQYQSDASVNYAVLALLDGPTTSQPISTHDAPYIIGRTLDPAVALQRQIPPRAVINGIVPSQSGALSSPLSTMTSLSSDADDKSTVYNVIDWEKTQVLNDMRKQLETHRLVLSTSGVSNSLGQK